MLHLNDMPKTENKWGNYILRCWVVAGLAAFSSGNAHAQGGFGGDDKNFGVRLTAGSTYDSNVVRATEAEPGVAGFDKADIRFTPAVAVDVTAPFGKQSVFVTGSAGYDFYRRNKQLNRERVALTGGLNLSAGQGCSGRVAFDYGRQQSDFGDFRRLVRVVNATERRGVSLNASCGSVVGLRPSLGYRREEVANSDVSRRQGDYQSNTITASIGYVRPSFGEASIYGSYRRGSYPERRTLGASPVSEKIDVFSGGVNFSRAIGRSLRGTVSAGYSKVDPNLPGVQAYGGISYSADLAWRPVDRLNLSIGASKDVQQSSTLDVSFSIAQNYRLNGSYALGRDIRVNFGVSHAKRQYRESPLIPLLSARTGDKSFQVSGGAVYTPRGRISFVLDVTGGKRSSGNRQFGYSNFVTSLGVRYGL